MLRGITIIAALALCACPKGNVAKPAAASCEAGATSLEAAHAAQATGQLHAALEHARAADRACSSTVTLLAIAEALADLGVDGPAIIAFETYVGTGGDRGLADARIAALRERPDPSAKVSAANRKTALLLYRDGANLRLQGDHDAAITQLRRSYALMPHPLTIVQIGMAHESAKRPVEARASFERALAIAEWSRNAKAVPMITPRHAGAVEVMTYSRDGMLLATSGQDGQIMLWDPGAGRLVRTIAESVPDWVRALAFNADRSELGAAVGDRLVIVWDCTTGDERRRIEIGGDAQFIALSPELDSVAVMRGDGVLVMLDDLGAQTWKHTGGRDPYAALAYSQDGSRLVAVGGDSIAVFDVASGSVVHKLPRDTDDISLWDAVAFTPDASSLAIAYDRGVALFDLATGKRKPDVLTSDELDGARFEFSADGDRLLTLGWRDVTMWNASTGERVRKIGNPGMVIAAAAVHPRAFSVATADSEGAIRIHDPNTGEELRRLGHDTWGINDISFHSNGTRIALSSDDGSIKIWDTATDEPLKSLWGHRGWVVFGAIDADGDRLVSGSKDETIRTWDLTNGKQIGEYPAKLFGKGNNALDVSRDGSTVAFIETTYGDGGPSWAVQLIDTRTGDKVLSFHPKKAGGDSSESIPTVVAMGPDDSKLAMAMLAGAEGVDESGHGSRIVVVDVKSRQTVGGMKLASIGSALTFSPDGAMLAGASRDPTEGIALWNAVTGEHIRTFAGHDEDFVVELAFSPDSKRLVSVARDHIVKMWDVDTGALLHTLTAHQAIVTGVAFTPDGAFFATSSKDRSVKFWDARTAALRASLMTTRKGNWVVTTPEGYIDGTPSAEELIYWQIGDIYLPGFVAWDRQRHPGLLRDILDGKVL